MVCTYLRAFCDRFCDPCDCLQSFARLRLSKCVSLCPPYVSNLHRPKDHTLSKPFCINRMNWIVPCSFHAGHPLMRAIAILVCFAGLTANATTLRQLTV